MQGDREIANQFSFLEAERGFRCVRRTYDAAHFGNAIVEYMSSSLRVRVIKDRGQFLCDFAASKGSLEWFDQEVVFRELGEGAAIDTLAAQGWSPVADVANSVRTSLDRIVELFSEGNYRQSAARFAELRGERVRRLFGDKVAEQVVRKEGV
jgi:hypothetical protein